MTVHSIIVAGGAGSRLAASAPQGTPDKPLLAADDGVRLIDRVLQAVPEDGQRIVVAGDLDLPQEVVRVREDPPLSGPASAIVAGVRALIDRAEISDEDLVVLLAADLLDPEAGIAALLAVASAGDFSADGAIATVDGRLQPLLSAVRLDALVTAISDDDFRDTSVMRLLRRMTLTEVEVTATAAADVDTWDDWTSYLRSRPVSWEDARSRIAESFPSAERSSVTKPPEPGDNLAGDVLSPMPVPHYTSSAMDGFAVSGAGPWSLLAAHTSFAAGRNLHRAGGTLSTGEALPVLTGSLIPDGTTAVVRSENATVEDSVLSAETPKDGTDVRPAGQEWSQGAVLATAGTVLTSRHVAMLSVCGVDEVEVRDKPRVACAFTGNEVIDQGVPEPGEVRDAFSTSFPDLLHRWGAQVVTMDRLPDDPVAVEDWLRRPDVRGSDIVVMTGGSGRSGQDFARRFITRAAEEVLAEGVACQPGHPTLITRRAGQLVIGVPGNPFAAHVALHSFVAPAVAVLSGTAVKDAVALSSATVTAKEIGRIAALRRDRVRLVPATLHESAVTATVTPVPGAHSHMLSGYAAADVLIVVPQAGLEPGETAHYLTL